MIIDPNIYIEDTIIAHLQRFTNEEATAKNTPWDSMRLSLNYCVNQGFSYMTVLHRLMQPYYEMFFYGEKDLCRVGPFGGYAFMNAVISADGEFPVWASNQDLISSAEGWGSYAKRLNKDEALHYICVLEHLISGSCCIDWQALAEQLKAELFNSEAYSDYKTDELLCILHALSMIMQQSWTIDKKRETFELLREHWGFMKHVYSMMIRHIVGSRLQNFAALANVVMSTNANLPHLEIFYCALTERMDSLGLDEKKFTKLDDAKQKMLSRINATKSSEILYELCDTLFPEEFQLMLRHKPKSYGELKEENAQQALLLKRMETQTHKLEQQLEESTLAFKMAVEASIPVEEIQQRLLRLPIATAWDIFNKLDRLLKTHPTWRQYDVHIHEALEQKEADEEQMRRDMYSNVEAYAKKPVSSTTIGHFYNQNGTYNDFSDATLHALPTPAYQKSSKNIEE